MSLLLLATVSLGQVVAEPEFEETLKEHQTVEAIEREASVEFGGSVTTGNTSFYTVTAALHGGYKWSENRVSGQATGLWGRGRVDADGNGTLDDIERDLEPVETARRVQADVRYDRFFGTRNSLYVLLGGLIDPFAGYDLRTHEQLGYSRHLVQTETVSVVVEVGMDHAREDFVDGVTPGTAQVVAAREMVGLKFSPGEDFGLENLLEAYESVLVLEDVRVNNTASLSAKLNGSLSLKLSHNLRFDNQPVEGFRPFDQTGLVTVVATLL